MYYIIINHMLATAGRGGIVMVMNSQVEQIDLPARSHWLLSATRVRLLRDLLLLLAIPGTRLRLRAEAVARRTTCDRQEESCFEP